MSMGREIELVQKHRAEEDLAVAAASILARHEFVSRLGAMEKEFGMVFPKGASAAVEEGRTGALLDDPRDDGEIARALERMLQSTFPSPQDVAATVERYRWDNVLLEYQRILARYAD